MSIMNIFYLFLSGLAYLVFLNFFLKFYLR